jgi:hypothetical protein
MAPNPLYDEYPEIVDLIRDNDDWNESLCQDIEDVIIENLKEDEDVC